jgi:mRNA interferase MazF
LKDPPATNLLNQYLQIVIACPLTTKIKRYKGNIILEPDVQDSLAEKSEIMIFHVRPISKERLVKRIGSISQEQLKELKQGLDDILRY